MPQFKRAEKKSAKPDRRGRIAVRIFLLDESKADLYPVTGNLREDLFVEDATVSEVAKLLNEMLFSPEETP